MDWVPFPNKMDGDGYTELTDHPDGAAHFGIWCALLMVASKCSPRGSLARSGGLAHDSASLARVTRLPSAGFAPAIARLLEIGWLEESGADPALSGADPAFVRRFPAIDGTERNGTERNGTDEYTSTCSSGTGRRPTGVVRPSVRPSVSDSDSGEPIVIPDKSMTPRKPPRQPEPDRANLTPEAIATMRELLWNFMAMKGTGMDRKVAQPDAAIVDRCLLAIGAAPLADVGEYLRSLFTGDQSPRHPNGPKGYAWFVTVLGERFGGSPLPQVRSG
jgi:hypothetical protein